MTDNSVQNSAQDFPISKGIQGTLIKPSADRPFTSVRFGKPKAPVQSPTSTKGIQGTLIEPSANRPFTSVRFGVSSAGHEEAAKPVSNNWVDEYLNSPEGRASVANIQFVLDADEARRDVIARFIKDEKQPTPGIVKPAGGDPNYEETYDRLYLEPMRQREATRKAAPPKGVKISYTDSEGNFFADEARTQPIPPPPK